ncbi:hypothetical protein BLA60_22290 [Actinophytocola xinjiangensis]|uniref:HTH luxR-type domain-containing protein n=1 Tax=Actinophytocola xinjiangensis TaxID=485602 RepID=A0A7Z1AWH5_9PSEU|nr:LuxR family transcriptional regulator [Actinophytocola xinjiangensis]OLF08743.1 hypothetical protein BLA60_22290 [Actinophytocola xinjiangensis]
MVESGGAAAGLVLAASRLVAREAELAAFAGGLAVAPALVLVEGEAGVGKSRLLRESLARTPPAGTVLVAGCPPFREPLTLGPVVDTLRRWVPDVTGLGLSALAGALRPLFPEWAGALPPLPEPAEDATASRHRLFRALAELLAGLDVAVLVVEDVHWADDATLEFLLFLAGGPDPVSLVLTYRPEDLPPESLVRRMSSRPARGTALTRIVLTPLDVTGTAALVSSMLHDEPLSEEFARFLHERTTGLPFAVEESVRVMHERAALVRRDHRWERVSIAELHVPATVRDAVLERFGRLGEDARAVSRAIAVLAEPADPRIVASVTGLDAGAAVDGLAEAVGSRLLREDDRGRTAFAHVLAARAVYEATPAPQRRDLHRRAATVLRTTAPESVARLALHYREAGETAAWHHYGEQAADLALTAGDEMAAGELLGDLATHDGVDVESLVRLIGKIPTGTLADSDRYGALVATLRRVLDRPGLAPPLRGRLRVRLGRLLPITADFDAARAEMENALPDLEHDPAEAVRAMSFLGWPVGTALPASAHLSWLERAAGLAVHLEPLGRLTLAVDRTTALLHLGEESGWAEAAALPDDAASPEQGAQVTRGHLNVGDLALRWGRYADARRHLDRAAELAERHQYHRHRIGVLVTRLHLDWFTGAWDGLAERAADLVRATDMSPPYRLEAAVVGALLAATGRATAEQAAATLGELLDEVRGQRTELHLMAAAALARRLLAQGRLAEALEVTEAPIEAVARSGIWLWATDIAVARLDALVADGRTARATGLVEEFGRWLGDRDAPAPRAALVTCRAILDHARGDHGAAAAGYTEAAAAWAALPRPYDAALAGERRGTHLLAAGRAEEATAVLSAAHDELAGCGASADAARVGRLLRELGVTVRPARGGRPSYGDQLSPRELEVVRLVVAGHTNRQIAERLYLSPWTVRHHVDAARRKLNAPSRAALALAAVEAGLAAGRGR